MDEKELEALFSILKEDTGISTKESLSHIISNDGIEVVYDEIQEGIFNDIETFVGAFNSVKKKEEGSVSESGTSDGFEGGETTFAGSFGADTEQLTEDFTPTTDAPAQDVSSGMMAMSTPKEEFEVEKKDDGSVSLVTVEKDARIRQETGQIQEKERLNLEEEQQRLLEETQELVQSDPFIKELESIDLESENPTFQLNEKYKKYGFKFSRYSKEGILARASNGEQIKIKKDDEQAIKDFISANAKIPLEVKEQDFLTKAFNVKRSRKTEMLNEDGSVSTVVMASADNIAFPTIFPKDPNSKSKDPKDWHVFDTSTREGVEKAIAMAEERGEIYKFETDEEANDFAEGEWKESSIEDIEGDKFFKDKGLDYMEIMRADRRHEEVNNELKFIKEQLGLSKQAEWNMSERKWEAVNKPSPEVIKQNPEIYLPNGDIRSDISERISELEAEEKNLRSIVVTNKKNSGAIEDFNRFLQKKSEDQAKIAAKYREEADRDFKVINDDMNYRLRAEGIKVPIDRISEKDMGKILKQYPFLKSPYQNYTEIKRGVDEKKNLAADNYYLGSTYFNSKTRKYIQTEYADNLSAFNASWKEGLANGNAAAMVMAMSLGIEDINDVTAKKISDELMKVGKVQGRAF